MPKLDLIDHVHVYAQDRTLAEAWYRRVLGLNRVSELEHWAVSDGPLFLSNPDHTVSLALFERASQRSRSTIAFRVGKTEFLRWREHFQKESVPAELTDHAVSWSLYFSDPEGTPFEITSYEYESLKGQLSL